MGLFQFNFFFTCCSFNRAWAEINITAISNSLFPKSRELNSSDELPEAKFVHGDRQVSWLAKAFVCVSVVHGDEVDVAEHEAFVVVLLQGLCVAHIEQFGPVKCLFSILRDKSREKQCLNTYTWAETWDVHLVHTTYFMCWKVEMNHVDCVYILKNDIK